MNKINFSKILPTIFAGAVIIFMIGMSVIFKDKEIIFPEIAALVTGIFLAPNQMWKDTGPFKFVFLMTLSALLGMAMAAYLSIPLFFKICIGYFFCIICLSVFKSGLFPMISACILPLLINAKSITYPISVFVLCIIIVGARYIATRKNKDETPKIQNNYFSKEILLPRIIAGVCIVIYSIYPCFSGALLLIAPPLFVMFTELFTSNNKFQNKEIILLAVTSVSTFTGSSVVYFMQMYFSSSTFWCGIIITVVVFTIFYFTKVFFPPIAALSFLPLILPEESLIMYPLYVSLTALVIVLVITIKRRFFVDREIKSP